MNSAQISSKWKSPDVPALDLPCSCILIVRDKPVGHRTLGRGVACRGHHKYGGPSMVFIEAIWQSISSVGMNNIGNAKKTLPRLRHTSHYVLGHFTLQLMFCYPMSLPLHRANASRSGSSMLSKGVLRMNTSAVSIEPIFLPMTSFKRRVMSLNRM